MNAIKTFNFGASPVRIIEINGEPWFVASDVGAVLQLTNIRASIALLDDDEKGVNTIDTLGGTQEIGIISESGLYTLILKSRRPEAKPFRKWVTSEVLPSIRKTGSYGQPAIPQSYPELLRAYADEYEARQALANQVKVDAPKVAFANDVLASNGEFLIGQVAYALSQKYKDFYAYLRRIRAVTLKNEPYAEFVYRGLFRRRLRTYQRDDGSSAVSITTYVTTKGVYWLHQRLIKDGLLPANYQIKLDLLTQPQGE